MIFYVVESRKSSFKGKDYDIFTLISPYTYDLIYATLDDSLLPDFKSSSYSSRQRVVAYPTSTYKGKPCKWKIFEFCPDE